MINNKRYNPKQNEKALYIIHADDCDHHRIGSGQEGVYSWRFVFHIVSSGVCASDNKQTNTNAINVESLFIVVSVEICDEYCFCCRWECDIY